MPKRLAMPFFFLGAPALLIACLLLLARLTPLVPALPRVLGISSPEPPLSLPELTATIPSSDARPLIIKKYLHKYHSPLEPFFHTIVEISDKWGVDYRLLVAIAQQESNLCKKIPAGSHNCWGYGIYGKKITSFDNYPQALETVAKTLKTKYLDLGLDTPEKIMAKYTPPSVDKGGPWARAIHQFLSDLE